MKVKALKVPKKEISIDDTISRFCVIYPRYTFYEAKWKLPYRRVIRMLQAADRERAGLLLELTSIAAAPHTKKGSGVKKLLDKYEKIFSGQ